MKSKKLFLAVLLAAVIGSLLTAGVAGAVGKDLIVSTAKLDMTSATSFTLNESFYLLIKVNDATDVAGAALTVEFDAARFAVDETNVSGNDYFIAASNTFTEVTDTRTPPGTPASTIPSIGNKGTGKVMLAGAFVNTNQTTGGGGAYTGEQILFKIKFKAIALGSGNFSVKQSQLLNTAAGWGTGDTPAPAPVLVGAVAKTHTDWTDPTKAYPVLLGDVSNPFTTKTITTPVDPGIAISGTVTYTGKQEGTLKVGAFSNANLQQQYLVGTGHDAPWLGSSQVYTMYVPQAGTYYIGGFIMSGAAHNDPSVTDAFGKINNSIVISSTTTGQNFTLYDPDVNTNNLPDWWEVKYGLYSPSSPISMNADQDNDGYSNLVEYQSYVNAANPGKNPTLPDPPLGTGYNPVTDNRSYGISGTVSYSGTKTGTLYVAAFATADTTFTTPIGAQQYAWATGKTSQAYTLNIPNGTYNLAAFIGASATRQATDAQGDYGSNVTLAGTALTGKNFTLLDPDQKKQMVSGSPANPAGRAGGNITFNVNYTTSDNNKNTTGLGLRIHYDPTKLTWVGFNNVLATDKMGQDPQPQTDTEDYDNDPTTTKYVQVAWLSVGGTWPNVDLPTTLYSVTFTAAEGLQDGTTSIIRFSASDFAEGQGYIFHYTPVTYKVQSFNLDVDGNAQAKALSDGLLIIRYLFGFTGDTLISGAVASGATRTTADAIKAYLDGGGMVLDADGNGQKKALSDGLLIIRYLFGFTGDTLISGAVASGATRTTADAIAAYLLSIKP
jgi:hypothetical protein